MGELKRRAPDVSAFLAVAVAVVLGSCAISPAPTGGSASPSVSEAPSSSFAAEPTPFSSPDGNAAELSVRLALMGDTGDSYRTSLTVMTDGRVITPSTPGVRGWVERRLTAAGVAAVVSLVEETGLFAESAQYWLVPAPGAPEPEGRGVPKWFVTLGDGSLQVVVVGHAWLGDEYEATYNLPSPARRALSTLAGQLSDLSWLPAEDWIDPEPTDYRPQSYALITFWQAGSSPGYPDVADVAWPFDGGLDEHGERLGGSDDPVTVRCGRVDRTQALEIRAQLNALLGLDPGQDDGWILNRAPDTVIELWLAPLLPDGYPGCTYPISRYWPLGAGG